MYSLAGPKTIDPLLLWQCLSSPWLAALLSVFDAALLIAPSSDLRQLSVGNSRHSCEKIQRPMRLGGFQLREKIARLPGQHPLSRMLAARYQSRTLRALSVSLGSYFFSVAIFFRYFDFVLDRGPFHRHQKSEHQSVWEHRVRLTKTTLSSHHHRHIGSFSDDHACFPSPQIDTVRR